MKIGIYALWLRPGIVGGTESFLRALLQGIAAQDQTNEYVLFTAQDNDYSFSETDLWPNVTRHVCKVKNASPAKRIAWENMFFDREVRASGVDLLYVPVYCKPRSAKGSVPYVVTIHDLQALHYPEYFSAARREFLKASWKQDCDTAARIVVISDYCLQDLKDQYPQVGDRACRIYDPVLRGSDPASGQALAAKRNTLEKYGLEEMKYDYCVSSLLPHKNLTTLLRSLAEQKEDWKAGRGPEPVHLVLSGVGGDTERFDRLLGDLHIRDLVTSTGFVSNEERDALYDGCRLFLFPSLFEGFGIPPIEAMRRGKRVVMTDLSCLGEVTGGKAFYVAEPENPKAWTDRIAEAAKLAAEDALERELSIGSSSAVCDFPEYDAEAIAAQYLKLFEEVIRQNG